MKPDELMGFMGVLEHLKCNTRHSWTTSGRQESVAEHSWRLAVLALLMKEDFPELDMEKVIQMCLVHDWGEAVTGDIPAFLKSREHELVEDEAIDGLISSLPDPVKGRMESLFAEMGECRTGEARLCKALDKIETLIQHNEAGLGTWLPLEYELNLTYGDEIASSFPQTRELKDRVREISEELIAQEKGRNR